MTVDHPPMPDDPPESFFPVESSSASLARQYQMEHQRRLHSIPVPADADADVLSPPSFKPNSGLDTAAISPKGHAPISNLPMDQHSSRVEDAQPLDPPSHVPGSFQDIVDYSFAGPSSAPAVPSVISVTHPPHFIHTHHPRRGSLTPLGLNVISPVAPQQVQQSLEAASVSSSPMRNVGFPPQGYSMGGCDPASPLSSRRDSVATVATTASASSNLTATRPQTSSNLSTSRRRSSLTPSISSLVPPAGFSPSARRPSLTPSVSTLAAPSSSRATAMGKSVRADGQGTPRMLDLLPHQRRSSLAGISPSEVRRGSLPQLALGGWTGPSRNGSGSSVNRGSIDNTATIDEGFRFGSGPPMTSRDDSAVGSLQRIATLTSANKRSQMSAFEAAEAQEAERQRRAFFDATYGADSQRARARLSLGGPSTGSPSSPSSTRRTSLLVWERVRQRSSDTIPSYDDVLAAARRPSLPVNIPPRSPTADESKSFDDQKVWDNPDSIDPESLPTRPLPPLMPLSDPVPRLLHGTLALHRANHLLSSRNVEPEPLPSPLPPSLHPPAPVDLSEFDIDFILAGSKSQLGDSVAGSSKRPSLSSSEHGHTSSRPTLEEEDSFAKFVGAFDDEYGDRRGDWTFRAVRPRPRLAARNQDVFPIDDPDDQQMRPRAEWESIKGGRFQILPNNDVLSVESGTVWSVHRTSTREFELQHASPDIPVQRPDPGATVPPNAPQPLAMSPLSSYTLTSKLVHAESGGVKLPLPVQKELKARSTRARRLTRAAARRRQSAGPDGLLNGHELLVEAERTSRVNSTDSTATAIPDPPLSPQSALQSSTSSRPPLAISPSSNEEGKGKARFLGKRTDSDEDKNKKTGLGGVFKRGLFKASNLLDERKERGHNSNLAKSASSISSSLPVSSKIHSQSMRHSASDRSDAASASADSSFSNLGDTTDDGEIWSDEQMFGSLGLGIEDEQNGGLPWKEGKAWTGVPQEALAMVIPIEAEKGELPSTARHSQTGQSLFINPFFVDGPKQVLLVWFTPFGQGDATKPSSHHGSSQTLSKIPEQPHHEMADGHPQTPLGRLPKLLRPRGSHRDSQHRGGLHGAKHIAIPPPTTPATESPISPYPLGGGLHKESHQLQPLPFKGFRVVAKVVDTEDLRSEPEVPVIALEQWTEQMRTGKPIPGQTPPLESTARAGEVDGSRSSPLVEAGIKHGREFPTIIAFCHSQNHGVEFVLEGLDRLGLCKGQSAWGPTGYEEWRGTGLSENGRTLVDLVWAGCSAVMGI